MSLIKHKIAKGFEMSHALHTFISLTNIHILPFIQPVYIFKWQSLLSTLADQKTFLSNQ